MPSAFVPLNYWLCFFFVFFMQFTNLKQKSGLNFRLSFLKANFLSISHTALGPAGPTTLVGLFLFALLFLLDLVGLAFGIHETDHGNEDNNDGECEIQHGLL